MPRPRNPDNPVTQEQEIELLKKRIARQVKHLNYARLRIFRLKKIQQREQELKMDYKKLKFRIEYFKQMQRQRRRMKAPRKTKTELDLDIAFIGSLVFARWANTRGLNSIEAYIMAVLWQYKHILMKNVKYFIDKSIKARKPLLFLMENGYIIQVKVKIAGYQTPLRCLALTAKGEELMKDREKFFYEKYEDMRTKSLTISMDATLPDPFKTFPGRRTTKGRIRFVADNQQVKPEELAVNRFFH